MHIIRYSILQVPTPSLFTKWIIIIFFFSKEYSRDKAHSKLQKLFVPRYLGRYRYIIFMLSGLFHIRVCRTKDRANILPNLQTTIVYFKLDTLIRFAFTKRFLIYLLFLRYSHYPKPFHILSRTPWKPLSLFQSCCCFLQQLLIT